MWYLNKSTQSLKAVSLEATTTDLDFVVVYHSISGRLNYGPTTGIGTIDNVLTTIVPSPAIDTQADVKKIIVTNVDNVDHNVVFYFNDGTDKVIFQALIEPNWSVQWMQETGWRVYNESGAVIVSSPTIRWEDIIGNPDDNQDLVDQIQEQIIDSLSGLSDYFFYGDASDIGGYYDMRLEASVAALETISNAGVSNGDTLASFATLANFPGITFLPAGVIKFRVYAEQIGGTQTTQLYAEVYKRDTGATETLFCTSGSSVAITGPSAQYEFSCAMASDVVLDATDRIVVKIKALVTGAGSAPDIDLFCEDNAPSRIELPITNIDLSNYVTLTGTQTLTNKRITARTGTVASNATPTINTDNIDYFSITALAVAITSMTTNLSGTPVTGDTLWIAITDDGTARAIAWGASFENSGTVSLPTTTVISTRLDCRFVWNEATSKWRIVGQA